MSSYWHNLEVIRRGGGSPQARHSEWCEVCKGVESVEGEEKGCFVDKGELERVKKEVESG